MRLALSIVALTFVAASCAHAPAPAPVSLGAPSGSYGAAVHARTAVDLAVLAAAPEKFKGKTVVLEGTVKDVCQGAGCWVEVQTADGTSFMAKSLDESVLLPKDCKGQTIRVEGVVTALEAKQEHEHSEAAGHVCPKPNFVVATKGATLYAKK